MTTPTAIIAAIDERRSSQEDARIQPASDKESNFNLDDFNIASVSMPVYFIFYHNFIKFFYLFDFCRTLFLFLPPEFYVASKIVFMCM